MFRQEGVLRSCLVTGTVWPYQGYKKKLREKLGILRWTWWFSPVVPAPQGVSDGGLQGQAQPEQLSEILA